MKETLIIKNFGPIKSIELDLRKINVLIGEQATGKSTIAKVLAVCRYFSYIVDYRREEVDKQGEFDINIQFFEGLRNWDIDSYLTEKSEIIYENSLYKFEYKNVSKEVDYTRINPISIPNDFSKLLTQLKDLKKDELKGNRDDLFAILDWTPNENFYRLNVKKIMDNPLFIPAERVAQTLSGKNALVSNAIQDELFKINKIVRTHKNEILIEPLSITYKNTNSIGYVKKNNEESFYTLHNGASGYQSAIPIVLAVKYYNEVEKRKRTFIIEEPEINLFPSAQKKLMAFFIKNVNENGHSFIIPTHSPYFLSAINDYLLAYKKGQINEKETNEIIKKEYWLNIEDVSCYQLKNGKAYPIIDKKSGLISDNIIDDVSDDMNDEFENLLDIR